MSSKNYICPYCSHATTITEPNEFSKWQKISIEKPTIGEVGFNVHAITCPNNKCKKLYLEANLTNCIYDGYFKPTKVIKNWQLLPESQARVLPDYIPEPIKNDYYESCKIKNLSPKAAATLARRCLQGMIRDYWKVTKGTLKEEIDSIEEEVDPLTWDAIDAVRKVGNIGAHMEKDINLIIDVEPEEAQLLIELIEQLVDDWYVERENKRQRLEKIKALAQSKTMQKKSTPIS